ncbi:MAG: cobyric acid synthase [Actinomycetota bacterium]|nr:cobyric acid synthase [Actinomycetota bacterium]
MRGGLMVCGTASDVGKSHVVAGLCRVLHRQGVSVAPFKAQNMANNSYVTPSGHEIGRAQGIQAVAAGAVPEVAMNPILLKPTGERTSQVVVMGRPLAHLDAAAYQAEKPRLFDVVLDALADLRRRFDVVVIEGAGSPAEINLLHSELVNLRLAAAAGVPAIVVGDIDRGGVFAAFYGTVALLPDDLRALVRGFVVNKFRGDPALLADGPAELERRCGVPTLGVLPYLHGVSLDAEDSLALPAAGRAPAAAGSALDVAVVRFPRIANFTDLDPLSVEPGVGVRFVDRPAALGRPDLVVLPGTKATVPDLEWLRGRGLDRAILDCGAAVLGICGGYQMMGRTIVDDVESDRGLVEGLGWLDAETVFEPTKITRQRRGVALHQRVAGYQIHHGRVTGSDPWIRLDDAYGAHPEGSVRNRMFGTTMHGILEEDGFRGAFLREISPAFVTGGGSFAAAREAQLDRLADMLEAHLDLAAVERLITSASPAGAATSTPKEGVPAP